MRRGWMDWVADEVPEDVLRGRIAQAAAACSAQGVDAVLYYTGFSRPAQVSALTHFVPFWSQALLAVTPVGASMLAMATTGRTVQLIRSASRVGEVVVGAEIGAIAGPWLAGHTPARRIAIASPDDLPQVAHESLRRALPEAAFEPAGQGLCMLEASFGPTPQVQRASAAIAESALALVSTRFWPNTHALVAALDGHCRARGAEDVWVLLAPDLARGAVPQRLEGQADSQTRFGTHFGLKLTLVYKGHWLRVGSSFAHGDAAASEHPACTQALSALRAAAARTRRIETWIDAVQRAAGVPLADWQVEARQGGLPLASCSASDRIRAAEAPACATFSARLAPSAPGGTPLIFSTFL